MSSTMQLSPSPPLFKKIWKCVGFLLISRIWFLIFCPWAWAYYLHKENDEAHKIFQGVLMSSCKCMIDLHEFFWLCSFAWFFICGLVVVMQHHQHFHVLAHGSFLKLLLYAKCNITCMHIFCCCEKHSDVLPEKIGDFLNYLNCNVCMYVCMHACMHVRMQC